MLDDPRRIAPILLASLVGLIAAGAVARAEPAAAASSSAGADCLANPSAPSAPGNHWYYRVDRASGRHCWYQRPTMGASNEASRPRPAARTLAPRATVSTRADTPAPAPLAERPVEARDQNATAPAASVQPYSWLTAAPPPAPREMIIPPTSDSSGNAAPAAAVPMQSETVAESQAEPTPTAPTRAMVPEQPATAALAENGSHMPALLGAASALLIIVLGSIAARLAAQLIRSRRRVGARRATASMMPPPPIPRADDAPTLVPPMPRERDITRASRPTRTSGRAPAARRDGAAREEDAAGRTRDTARQLEENVRDLLRRMRSDLQAASRQPENPRPTAQDFDPVPAMWRTRRRRPAG